MVLPTLEGVAAVAINLVPWCMLPQVQVAPEAVAQVLVVTSLTEPQARQIQVVVVVADQVEPVLAV